jgi:hypothetical protein
VTAIPKSLLDKVDALEMQRFFSDGYETDDTKAARAALLAEIEGLVKDAGYKDLYFDLLYCVGDRYHDESRHETAKRYLLSAESHDTATAGTARAPEEQSHD